MDPYSPNIIVGGTYAGYLVLWDVREKNTPVQRTPMSQTNSYPIYCLDIVGTQNAHSIISVSNNGRLCQWASGMLNTPQKSVDLRVKKEHSTSQYPLASHTMAFPHQETNNCYIGGEDFSIYHCQVHSE